ncbi:uncharacterized protein LOC108595656 isoform X2 [Drosophila busckii]|uniref:uncharacterized protein LOC108595656 isoform X2 n=1 Tax=Drosophila busckii TaxID=30019 RepID=UPI00083EEA92|nr:uncharacterized protein LOC108595656 isoform X2 [Drosophila busckii]
MKDLDLTLDYMENAKFNYIYGPILAHLESPFTETELLCLSMIYHKFVLENGPRAKYMTMLQLSSIIELMFKVTDRELNSSIVSRISYDPDCTDPKYSHDRHCSLPRFIKMFSIYFSTDLEKRMQFVFSPNRFMTKAIAATWIVSKLLNLWKNFLLVKTRMRSLNYALICWTYFFPNSI